MTSDAEELTHVEFRSDRFPPYKGEEKQINPDLWGKRLAEFLCAKLPGEGVLTGKPSAQDWGWRVDVVNKNFAMWIGCGHYQEYDDGCLCFIEPHTPFISPVRRLFIRMDVRGPVGSLRRALDKILCDAEGIREKRWWTHSEFNHTNRRK